MIKDVIETLADHNHLTASELVGGLRILASMVEAKTSDGKLQVNIVNIEEEDSDPIDPSDYWKYE